MMLSPDISRASTGRGMATTGTNGVLYVGQIRTQNELCASLNPSGSLTAAIPRKGA